MANAVIATFPTEPVVLVGQSLIVRTIFDNRGTDPISVPRRSSQSQFVYFLQSKEPNGPRYGLSQEATARRRSPDLIRRARPEFEQLPGGAKFERVEDIAGLWNEGFAPGDYWLTVQYEAGGLRSPKSEVTVRPLDLESFSSFVSVDHLSTVAAHRGSDGQVVLLHRESQVRDPREGVFVVRQTLAPGGPVSVATSIDVAPAGNGRWFAWLRDGKLNATNAWGDRIIKTTDPLDADGTLLSEGFQVALGTALFGTVSPAGRLDTFVASPDGFKRNWSAELGGTVKSARWNAQPDGSVTVAWEESESGKIMRRSFEPDGRPRDPAPHAATPGRPLTWGFPPSGAPVIWVIVLDGRIPVLARLPATGERSLTRLPELPDATVWDFYQTPAGAAAVVALANNELYSARLPNVAWRRVAAAPRASQLRVLELDRRGLWAEWFESGFGMRRVKLP